MNKNIRLPFKSRVAVLALGGQAKNTVCFAKGASAQVSAVARDLATPEGLLGFEKEAGRYLRKKPRLIAHDLHHDYASTQFAAKLKGRGLRLVPVQHHHAHIASCMAENRLNNKKVIGVAFDGTGLGADGSLWGAEFLICDYRGFIRAAHLKEVPLLGNEMAIREPWRLAAAWLDGIYNDRFLKFDIKFVKGLDKARWQALKKIYRSGFNPVFASSMGRLFDAAASLALCKYKAGSEGELAIALEQACVGHGEGLSVYEFKLINKAGTCIIDPAGVFKGIIRDLKNKRPVPDVAYSFHLSVAGMVREVCLLLRKSSGIKRAVLSGGVFQNKVLLRLVSESLVCGGFEVLTHRDLSCNDSGISLGQAVIVAAGS